jgi:Bacterial low temperature requirement A protein (LtrA)
MAAGVARPPQPMYPINASRLRRRWPHPANREATVSVGPTRSHGAAIVDRRVSFLELFYDLVYVAVIGQAAHQLAEHLSVRGVVEFAIIIGLIC